MAGKSKDLASLLRLHGWQVDERRRELAVLVAREDGLVLFGQELHRQLLREQKTATEDPTVAGFIYAVFAADHRRRREQLERTLDDLRDEIEMARERLADAFRQLKVYEQVEKQRARREQAEEIRQETITYNDIGQTQHRLKQQHQSGG
jgi:flagellar export protein FliJ